MSTYTRALSLRAWTVLLAALAPLPVIIYALVVTLSLSRSEQDRLEVELQARADSLAALLQAQTQAMVAAAQVLAESKLIDQSLRDLHAEASAVAERLDFTTIVLLAPDGRQVLNTRLPFGAPLPLSKNPEAVADVFERGRVHVSNTFKPPLVDAFAFSINVPVWRDGAVKYAMVIGVTADRISSLLGMQNLAEGWLASVVDRKGAIVGRSVAAEHYVGKPGSLEYLDAIARSERGVIHARSKEGEPMVAAFVRVPQSGWTVAVGVPRALLRVPLRRGILLVSWGAGLALVGSGLLFYVFGRLVSRDVRRVADSTAEPSRVTELRWLNQTIMAQRADLDEMRRVATERAERAETAEREAHAANLAKTRFLAAASHDLRQPMQALRLLMEALRGDDLSPRTAAVVETMDRALRGGEQLLTTLLDVARLDTGVLQLRRQAMSCRDLLAPLQAECEAQALAKGLKLRLSPIEAVIDSDPVLLRNLLRNLIGNAIKYTPRGGVLVGCRRRNGQVVFQVWDTGVGIAPEKLAVIWDEFYQIGNPTRDPDQGFGLGLAIVRKTAQLLDLKMAVRSRPDHGSVFEVTVPLAAVTVVTA